MFTFKGTTVVQMTESKELGSSDSFFERKLNNFWILSSRKDFYDDENK